MQKWTRVNFQPNLPLKDGKYVTSSEEHIVLSRIAAEEGMVLLKNEYNLLPLTPGTKLCLFGKGTFDYVKGGGGSGDVYCKYVRNFYDGLKMNRDAIIYEPLANYYRQDVKKQYEEGAAPGMTIEPELPIELLEASRTFSDIAVITISRFSGEGWDRSSVEYNGEFNPWPDESSMPKRAGVIFPDGDFYLTAREKSMITQVTGTFPKVIVVLNIGGVIDTSWIKNNPAIDSALLAWQGGMEGGLAAANILFGRVNPSGKLTDTFAASVDDYPSTAHFHDSVEYVEYTEDIYVGYRYFETLPGMRDKICYPFGFGLSYTNFAIEVRKTWLERDRIHLQVGVRNTGTRSGKEVVQVYYSAPQGKLGKPNRALAAFAKTELLQPQQEQILSLSFERYVMASFDDTGLIRKSAYVLEQGAYRFYVGSDLHNAELVDFVMTLEADEIVQQLSAKLTPTSLEKRLRADGSYEELTLSEAHDPNECIFPKMIGGTEEAVIPAVRGRDRRLIFNEYLEGVHPLMDVVDGKISMEDFLVQLSDEDLISLLGGQPNTTVANDFGFGNLPEYGVPNVMTADGPAGVRILPICGVKTTAWPCGTLLASTWNTEIVKQVGKASGAELKENNLAVLLAPAINIHRNPLCGRNFEYYSEDPVLTGHIGAAMVQGIQSNNVSACIKHFACNNKETNRKHSDSRLSERAMREIYLKAFEIIVKTADPWAIMSSYNVINGRRASESRELLEDILRGEWGYQGMVTSDWWTRGEHYKEILAGNDVKMATGYPERVKKAQEMGAITRADLERCARRVLELIIKID